MADQQQNHCLKDVMTRTVKSAVGRPYLAEEGTENRGRWPG